MIIEFQRDRKVHGPGAFLRKGLVGTSVPQTFGLSTALVRNCFVLVFEQYVGCMICISAAPAALDRYLAASPAMSLIPFAPLYLGTSRRTRPLPSRRCRPCLSSH